jgi:hypothetical protein
MFTVRPGENPLSSSDLYTRHYDSKVDPITLCAARSSGACRLQEQQGKKPQVEYRRDAHDEAEPYVASGSDLQRV